MSTLLPPAPPWSVWPDHTQLPDSNGTFVKNFQEHPQSILLTESLWPVLKALRPDGWFAIGQDSGIYWRMTEPPEKGAEAPDWFLLLDVPPVLGGRLRRSYVLWQEFVSPLVLLEFVSGDGTEERDRTPMVGKFWVYEQVIRPAYYGIYEVDHARIEMHQLVRNRFLRMQPNEHGRYAIEELRVELGLWQGKYQNAELPWMRWWDANGQLLPTGEERAEQEHQRAERLAAKLRELGIDPETIK